VDPGLAHGWRTIEATRGRVGVAELAAELGWSRRHLAGRFRTEFGLSPKTVARTLRFGTAVALLRRTPHLDLASVAASCGYYDQSHLTREFGALAGCSPRAWVREEFPSIQDGSGVETA
jgi:transcriptional regulator GlxA family with amidase domain